MQSGERKSMGELVVAARFVEAYNKLNGTDYGDPHKPPHVAFDAEVESSSGNFEPLLVQIVKADPDQIKALATTNCFERKDEGFCEVFRRLWAPIGKKANKYAPDLKSQVVLLVDGSGFFLPEVVKAFSLVGDAIARESGFCEIWFVGMNPETTVLVGRSHK